MDLNTTDINELTDLLCQSLAEDQEINGVYPESNRDHRKQVIKQVIKGELEIGAEFKKINWVDIYARLHDSFRYSEYKYGELLLGVRQHLRNEIMKWVGETLDFGKLEKEL